jgi:hypothetical protein
LGVKASGKMLRKAPFLKRARTFEEWKCNIKKQVIVLQSALKRSILKLMSNILVIYK